MKDYLSKVVRLITNKQTNPQTKKGNTEKKETIIDEGSCAGTEAFVEPENDVISVAQVQDMYDNSSLLKKFIRVITEEAKRYTLVAKPKAEFRESKKAKAHAVQVNTLLSKCNSMESYSDIREKYLKDLFLYGRAGIEIQPTNVHNAQALYAVPGYCIRLNVDATGSTFNDVKTAYMVVNPNDTSEVVASFPEDSFIYGVLDPMSDRIYGSMPITSVYTDLITDRSTSKNIRAGANSIKAGVLCLPKAPRKLLVEIVNRLTKLCKGNATTKIVAANTEGTFLDLSSLNPKDNIELQQWLFKKANIWNIPLFKLGLSEDSGSLNAREQLTAFRDMIESLIKSEVDKLNSVLINSKLGFDDIEIICPNFATKLDYERARIAVRLVNGKIITPNEAREKYLGLDKSEDPRADSLIFPEDASANSDNTSE